MKYALVLGGGGFIGSHLVSRLKSEGFWVRAVDLKFPEFSKTSADNFIIDDLRNPECFKRILDIQFDEIYQLAADMGGTGYIGTGNNDSDILHNSCIINLNLLDSCVKTVQKGRIFYSSSACVYPEHNQTDSANPNCAEDTVYPAEPDTDYGWEKLFSERLYLAYRKNKGLNTFIARYHNIFGPLGTWNGGKEKAPAAICRKVAEADRKNGDIDIWGDGLQTRSFLYIDECIEGTLRLMRSNWTGPVNIGSEEMVSIKKLAEMIIEISGKKLEVKPIPGPVGVMGRNSDNRLIKEKLNWAPTQPLKKGLEITYSWIKEQVAK